MSAVTTQPKPQQRSVGLLIWLAVTAILSVAGFIAWINQVGQGMVVTDMRDITMWGLYIVGFMFFVGLSAGGLIMSTVPRVFGVTVYKPIAKLATFLSLVCTLLAMFFIVPDIGRPERMWHLIAYGNLQSPLVWDVIIITVYLILSIVYLRAIISAEKSGGEGASRTLAYIVLPVAILVHSITAWVFGLQISRPFWNSALLAPMFITSALVSGLGLLLFVVLILRAVKYLVVSDELIRSAARLLAIFILVDLFFLFSEILTAAYPQSPEGLEPVLLLLSQTGAPMFWFEVLLGGALAVVLLLVPGLQRSSGLVGLAAVLAIIAIFFKRFNLLMAGFALPLITQPTSATTGVASPNASTFLQATSGYFPYFPSLIEWGIAVGVVAFGALLLTLGLMFLPLRPKENQ